MAASQEKPSGMDIRQAQTMWRTFSRLMVWTVSVIVVILILMALTLL